METTPDWNHRNLLDSITKKGEMPGYDRNNGDVKTMTNGDVTQTGDSSLIPAECLGTSGLGKDATIHHGDDTIAKWKESLQ